MDCHYRIEELYQHVQDRLRGSFAAGDVGPMKGRGERLVYWYDKEWSIGIASKVEGCGGTARFVTPKP